MILCKTTQTPFLFDKNNYNRDSGGVMMTNYYSYIKTEDTYLDGVEHATYKGIALKTVFLLALTILVGVLTAFLLPTIIQENFYGFYMALTVASIVGFISVLIGRISDRAAMVCSFIYSICEGLLLGTITAVFDALFPGSGTLSIVAVVVIFAIMLILYAFGFVRNGSLIRMITFGLLATLLALVIFDWIYIIVTGQEVVFLYFLIQAFLLVYGVITLAFNFAEAEAVVKMGASKQAEWSVALGMEVSLVFIYLQVLRIIAIIMSSRR